MFGKHFVLLFSYFRPTISLTAAARMIIELHITPPPTVSSYLQIPVFPLREILSLAAAALFLPSAQSAVFETNPYTGAYNFAGQTSASILTVSVSEPTFTLASSLAKIGVESSSAADRFMASQWSTNSFDNSKYFEFTLTSAAAPGITFASFDSFEMDFALRRSSTGPRQFQWRSSLDNFAAPITTYTTLNPSLALTDGVLTLPDTASTQTFGPSTFSLSAFSLANKSNIALRLYSYQAESSLGQAGLDTPLTFSGNVVVPEPSTITLLALSAAAGMWWKMRRRRP